MKRAQFAIVSAACLLTLLGVLYPLSCRPHEVLGFMPWPMWLLETLQRQQDVRDPITIAWFAMAIEFSFINLLTGMFYVATYLRGRVFFLYSGLVVLCPILILIAMFLYMWKHGAFFQFFDNFIWMEGYFLLAFVAGLCLPPKQKIDRFAASVSAGKESQQMPMRINIWWSQLSYGYKVLIGLWLLPACCLLIIGVQSRQEAARTAAAPHLKAEELIRVYEKAPGLLGKRYDHKFIVVTGTVDGMDAGLLGDGCLYMGAINCDVSGEFGPCRGRATCTVAGTCEGKDENGVIHIANGRELP